MEIFLQTALMGLFMGSIYCLLGLVIVLIYKATEFFNLGVGGLIILGAYIFFFFFAQLGLPIWISLIGLIIIAILVGLMAERFTMRPLIGQPHLPAVMLTLALWIFLEGVTVMIWGGGVHRYPPGLPRGIFEVGGAVIPQIFVIGFVITVVLVVALVIFFHRHRLGLGMRVTAESHKIAQSLGINVNTSFSITWGISSVMAMIAGVILAVHLGLSGALPFVALKALAVPLLGGMNSIPGCVLAALIVGMTEATFNSYLNPIIGGGVGELAPQIIIVLILMIRPYGLFGIKGVERV